MITPSYGLTATERVLPALALDWATGLPQAGVDVVRAGAATFVGSNGLIQSASENTQRVDYSSGVAALLVEEARTNIMPYSEDFRSTTDVGSARPWSYINVTITPDQIISPDGTQNADQLVETTANANHYVAQSPTLTDNTVYTYSVYAKKGSKSIFMVALITKAGGLRGRLFDLDNGTSSALTATGWTTAPTGFGIENAGNGWYRCWVSNNVGAGAVVNNCRATMIQDAATVSYTGSTDNNTYIWGAQTEPGASPTSYIPTVATTVTRNADVPKMTGTNFSNWFNASAGTFFINTNARNADVLLTAGGYSLSADATALKKYATTYTADPSATELVIGKGSIQKILYYKQALIAAELAALVA
jgi:hypothetical protein